MVDLSFSIEGEETVHRSLGIVAKGVTSFKEPLGNIGKTFLKTFDMNFSSRGALYGGWTPRKPVYKGGTRIDTWPLMEKTGRMRKSFEMENSGTSLLLTNSVPYFVYHQSNQPRAHLPRRVMMKLRAQDASTITKTFQMYLIDLLRQTGER
jgi:phage gpG-like protein